MSTMDSIVILYRLINIPIYETVGALIEIALLCCGFSIKLARWERRWNK